MCGIAGWIDFNGRIENNLEILDKMVETLSNRGPDASGTWTSKIAGIGHRRLAVIDPQNGAQPMVRKLGEYSFIITYNGELYNTNELRSELQSIGYTFYTNCDTEVVLVAYIEWGQECVKKFNGIYAIGIWDQKNENLFIARDRFGVKPFFYTIQDGSFIFASELKSILAHPFLPHEIDGEGLAEIFALGPSRTPGMGIFKDTYELKPGHCGIYSRNGLKINRYWQLESKPHEDNLQKTTEKVRKLIIDAINRQLISDVPLCTFLSGGLDSSAITAIAAETYRQKKLDKLNTYSVDYVDNDLYFQPNEFQPNADSAWINKMSDFSDTIHHNINIGVSELGNALEDAVKFRDLPGMADVDSSLLLFCKEIKKDYTVGLSGECADEIFGGYPWFSDPTSISSNTFPWLRSLDERLKIFSGQLVDKMKPIEYVNDRYLSTISEVPKLIGEDPVEAKRRELFYLNITWFMATLLDRKDRMSMATGLEVRVPFCDHNIVEYVWNIPWEVKNIDGREKGIMRRALKGILPDDIRLRRKSPYPKTYNPQYTKYVSDWLLRILDDSNSPLLDLIDVTKVKEIALSGGDVYTKPWFGQLMKGPQLIAFLIQVDIWLKHYKVKII